ncbi:MAG: heavy metal translocating P-type ATPase [Ardenticatenaceae bacterium]
MILNSVVIAGVLGAGTLSVSVKVYREEKRKRDFPWTVAAERMAKNELPLAKGRKRSPFGAKSGMIERVTSSIRRVRATSQAFTQEMIAPFVDETRNQQLAEITRSEMGREIQMQKDAKRNFYVSSASLLFISTGALFYAPLYVPGVLGQVYIYSFFLKPAYDSIVQERRINADVLFIAIGTGAMAGGFFFAMALGGWYTCTTRWLLSKIENHSRDSLVNLFGEQPRFVYMVVDGSEIEVPFSKVQIGDQVVITAGQMIPVDGTISAGIASIDQHKLTGEGQLAEKSIGDEVFASTVVLSGKVTIRVEKTGSETVAAQIGHILNNTADFNLSIQSRVESFLNKVVPGLLVLSGASLPWLGLNGAVGMLWCCPGFRMFIVGPMGMLNYLHILSRQGILIKDGRSLEQLSNIDTIVFDKTGTLTEEMPVVNQIFSCSHPLGKLSEEQLLTYAAAAEYRQTHPIANAILHAADERDLDVPQIDDIHYEVGYGVKVKLNERIIRVGSARFMQMCGITIPVEIKKQQARCQQSGYSLVYVAIDEQLAGTIELMPKVRPEVKEVIRALSQSGKTLYIISGDHETPTRRLAEELGIDYYFANILPENKAALVKQLQESGRSVCFIGDGINDAIALKQADVSISLRGATTIAMDTADIVLMDGSLSQLVDLFELGQEFNANLNHSFMMTTIPEIMIIAGTFFFGWGLLTAVIFESFFWLPQLGNVMWPLYKHKERNKQQQ